MFTNLKIKDDCCNEEPKVFHDAHIKDYYAQRMGINLVIFDSNGIPISEEIAPITDYFPNTSLDM